MRELFRLTSPEQRVVLVVMIVLLAAAVAKKHHESRTPQRLPASISTPAAGDAD